MTASVEKSCFWPRSRPAHVRIWMPRISLREVSRLYADNSVAVMVYGLLFLSSLVNAQRGSGLLMKSAAEGGFQFGFSRLIRCINDGMSSRISDRSRSSSKSAWLSLMNSHIYSWRYWRSPRAAFSFARTSGAMRGQSVAGTLMRVHSGPPADHVSQKKPRRPKGVDIIQMPPLLTTRMGRIAL